MYVLFSTAAAAVDVLRSHVRCINPYWPDKKKKKYHPKQLSAAETRRVLVLHRPNGLPPYIYLYIYIYTKSGVSYYITRKEIV